MKEVLARFPDDTVVRIDPAYRDRWKHHKSLTVPVAVICALYPFLAPYLDDETISFHAAGSDALVKCTLALRMVHERFGYVDRECFSKFSIIARNGMARFGLYTDGNHIYTDERFGGMEYWQLCIDYAAILFLEEATLDCTLEETDVADVPEVVAPSDPESDATPLVLDFGSTAVFYPDADLCHDSCELCYVLQTDWHECVNLCTLSCSPRCKRKKEFAPARLRVLTGPDIGHWNIVRKGNRFRPDGEIGSADNPRRIDRQTAEFLSAMHRVPPDIVLRNLSAAFTA
nr:MAG: hypothetical protein [Aspergillus flavus partitivirus 1]